MVQRAGGRPLCAVMGRGARGKGRACMQATLQGQRLGGRYCAASRLTACHHQQQLQRFKAIPYSSSALFCLCAGANVLVYACMCVRLTVCTIFAGHQQHRQHAGESGNVQHAAGASSEHALC